MSDLRDIVVALNRIADAMEAWADTDETNSEANSDANLQLPQLIANQQTIIEQNERRLAVDELHAQLHQSGKAHLPALPQ